MLRIAIDTETTGLNSWTGDKPFAVSMCDERGNTLWWEWIVDPHSRQPRIIRGEFNQLQDICGDPKRRKVFFNADFDILMFFAIGIEVVGPVEDVMFKAKAVNNLENNHKLKYLGQRYLGINNKDELSLKAETKKSRGVAKRLGWNTAEEIAADYWIANTLWKLAPKEARAKSIKRGVCEQYGVTDAVRTIMLDDFYNAAMTDIRENEDCDVDATYEMEMGLLWENLAMEKRGIAIDEKVKDEQLQECHARVLAATEHLRKVSGNPELNPESDKDLREVFYNGKPHTLPILVRTDKKRLASTARGALEPFIGDNPEVDATLSYRANSKAISTFYGKYDKLAVRDKTGQLILHPNANQWGAKTGRYSISAPALQQVTDGANKEGPIAQFIVDVRKVFIPRKDHVIYAFDYSQVEVIIFAEIAGEETLLEAIRKGEDIHSTTTNKVWGGRDNPGPLAAAPWPCGRIDPGPAWG